MNGTTFLAATLLLCIGSVVNAQDLPTLTPKTYEIGIAPSHITTSPNPLLTSKKEWNTVAEATDMFKYYGVQVVGAKWATSLDVEAFVTFTKKEKINIGCEFGSFHLTEEGASDAITATKGQLDPIVKAGGRISSIHLDGPFRRLMKGFQKNPNALTLEQICAKLVEFWEATRERYPGISIGLITNFPNWDHTKELVGYNGHYTDQSGITFAHALNVFHKALTAAGDRIDFIEIDCPYNYYRETRTRKDDADVDNARKFREVKKWCDAHNISFTLIINAEPRVQGAKGFHDLTCEYIRQLRKDGIFPDRFLIQSWYKQPAKHLPESEPNTFMNTAKDAIALIRELYPSK